MDTPAPPTAPRYIRLLPYWAVLQTDLRQTLRGWVWRTWVLATLAAAGGYLLYLRQEGRGIGLYAKLDAYALQDAGLDTYQANLALGHREDERSYAVAAQMLLALGVPRVALLSNNPDKARQLRRFGVTVAARVPTGVHLSATNARYLETKARRGAHTLDVPMSAG